MGILCLDPERGRRSADGADPLRLRGTWQPTALVRGRPRPSRVRVCLRRPVEREYTGVAVFDLLEAAAMPGDTTHVQFESVNGDLACIPLADLNGAVLALGDGPGTAPGRPRFVSPRVLGPRTVKNVCRRSRGRLLPALIERPTSDSRWTTD